MTNGPGRFADTAASIRTIGTYSYVYVAHLRVGSACPLQDIPCERGWR